MLAPTDAELLSVHYLTGEFVDSHPDEVTIRITELMSQGVKVMCDRISLVSREQADEEVTMDEDRPLSQPPTSRCVRHTYRQNSSRASRGGRQPSTPISAQTAPSPRAQISLPPTNLSHSSPPPCTDGRRMSVDDRLAIVQRDQARIFEVLDEMRKEMASLKEMFVQFLLQPTGVDVGQTSVRREKAAVETEEAVATMEEAAAGTEETVVGRKEAAAGTEETVVGRKEAAAATEEAVVGPEESRNGEAAVGTEEGRSEEAAVGTEEGRSEEAAVRSEETVGRSEEAAVGPKAVRGVSSLSFEQRLKHVIDRSWVRVSCMLNLCDDSWKRRGFVLEYDKK